ncbi:site-2 protease family protein [Caulobacter segnis]|uniref:site-2 protease family protein n=1 Tax=Caulobacter segnis TaxID=88688 RepID=UPI00241043BD|nr:site-2 protease family protein [Caulobacter segnis]MDG2523709.1 site-2 protease family protein [Caulobacter segnis]
MPITLSRNGFILIGLFLAFGAALAAAPSGPLVFAFVLAGWMISVGVHEFGHAFVAWRAGDTEVVGKGYLSFDPLKYADLSTSLILPVIALALGGIGFPGGAVYLREDLMRSRMGRSMSSLAGPLGTLLVLIVLAVVIAAGWREQDTSPVIVALAFLAFLQATALILNLLPIPGLDGYGVLRPWLPVRVQRAVRKFEALGILALLALLFLVPGASGLLIGTAVLVTDLLGVPREAIVGGWDAFTFWKQD